MRNCLPPIVAVVIALLPMAAHCESAKAAPPEGLDFSAWRTLPVFDRGRRMPLESFANVVVREICGRENPTLDPCDILQRSAEGSAARRACAAVFPDGKPRRFSAPELLFSWLMEPELWEHLPFLEARHEELRRDLLGLPLRSRDDSRLKHVSPARVIESEAFRRRLGELGDEQSRARRDGREHSLTGTDRHVNQLYQAYALYRLLTYNPAAELDLDANQGFSERLMQSHNLWIEAAPHSGVQGSQAPKDAEQSHQAVREAFEQLAGVVRDSTFTAPDIDPLVVQFRAACDRFAQLMDRQQEEVLSDKAATGASRALVQRRAAKARELAATAEQLHRSLYDVGRAVRLVPGLDPEALRADRDLGDDRPPWLSIQTLLLGSDALLAGMPKAELQAVRRAYARLAEVHADRRGAQRERRFADAMGQFADSVRALGEAVEPLRQALDIPGNDDDRQRLLAETVYPSAAFNRAELHYNRIQPFLWSWVLCLLATVCTAVSFGLLRKPLFWLAIAILVLAQTIIAYGLALRTYITGYMAVTNMFESVVFMAYTVAFLAVWFTLLPLLWPGILTAWRLTALPPPFRAALAAAWRRGVLRHAQVPATPETPPGVALGQWLLLLPQLALMAVLIYALTMLPYGSGGRAIFRLTPSIDSGQSLPTSSDLLAWLAGLAVLAPTVWLTPRLLFAFLISLAAIPRQWAREGTSAAMQEAYARRLFILVGAAVGFLAGVIAYQAPIFNRDIQALQPVLRDNFWLTMHVLSITASYGAGALAWGLANIALVGYLFGRYRQVAPSPGGAAVRKPPELCHWLGGFIYRAIQVAVLLLTVGTILGALWADVAWGKFWSWDAKEVWSLICILAYMAILHGRYIGWFGDFGLTAGAIMGLTTILMTWYGVNYVFGSGLHSYGGGAGGQYEALGFAVANWLFLGAAAIRYLSETRRSDQPES